MDSSVLLRTDELLVREDSREPLDLAVLSGSMLVFLGDGQTVAPSLARVVAGIDRPFAGRVLLGDEATDIHRNGTAGRVVYVSENPPGAGGVTVREHLRLAAAAAGHRRKKTGEVLSQLIDWCSLEKVADRKMSELPADEDYMVRFAAACLPLPEIFVLQGPFPDRLHPLLDDLCSGGCAVIASLPGVRHMPGSAERIALCDARGARKTVRFQELFDACMRLMRLRVSFFPALPRGVMESLPGARDILSISGWYEFRHGGLSAAVTNLVNLARANSRQIAGLEVRPPTTGELMDYFTAGEKTGEADLFCGEDLDT